MELLKRLSETPGVPGREERVRELIERELEGVVDELREHATNGERIHLAGDALWIHYVGGVGRSKISPGLLDRIVGSPVTTRNWRTAVKLAEMAGVAAR